jgi:hypothetical protein
MQYETSMQPGCLSGGPEALKFAGSQVEIDPNLVDDLDYWEVDPDWGGEVFHSAVQAIRPRKKGSIPGELALPEPIGENSIAVRLVKIDGEQTQIIYPG